MPNTLQMAAVGGLEAACNRVITMDPSIGAKLEQLSDKVIHILLDGPNIHLYFLPEENHISIQSHYEGKPTTSVQGKPSDFVELMVAKDPGSTLINGGITVKGETGALMDLQQAFRNTDLDWEYELSQIVGDIAAHEIGKAVRKAADWLKGSQPNVKQQFEQYVNEQSSLLPSREEIAAFCSDVDSIATRTERLEALLRRK